MNDAPQMDRTLLAKRLQAANKARDDLLAFARYMNPDPNDPDDVAKSTYEVEKVHKVICAALEQVEAGLIPRLILSLPPRTGKSTLASRLFPAWYMGKNPSNHIMLATYNETFSEDFGRNMRLEIQSPLYRQVFPELKLKAGAKSAKRMMNTKKGVIMLLGRKGSATGRGGDLILIDDPIKNREEADSETIREQMWTWFNQVIKTRMMTERAAIVIIQCMTGDTPVLMADGTERPLRDVRPGDTVATYREGVLSTSTVRNWINNGPDLVYEIRMTSGKTVKANERHPFLVHEHGELKWVRLRDLRRGHEIVRVNGASGRARLAVGKDATSLFAAGATACRTTTRNGGPTGFVHRLLTRVRAVLHTSSTAMASCRQTMIGWLRSRAASALSAASLPARTSVLIGAESSVSITATTLELSGGFSATTATSLSDTRRFLKSQPPLPNTSDFTLETVAAISPAGVEDVFDIQIDETENFIANGLVSHNTRWHEDDLVGRITDETNPNYNAEEARLWKVINIPAIADEGDPLGREPGEPLWPGRFGRTYLERIRAADPRGFQALYQGDPTPPDGMMIPMNKLVLYKKDDRLDRSEMRFYGASDMAVSDGSRADKTCHMIFGVDSRDRIWVMPEIFWEKAPSDVSIEKMIDLMERYKPLLWFCESGQIQKSLGPFLRKRMSERRVYCALHESFSAKDKATRAQSIVARMSMGLVRFPNYSWWWPQARDEMTKFPNGRYDDLVDALSLFGLGLDYVSRMRPSKNPLSVRYDPAESRVGSVAWIKAAAKREEMRQKLARDTGGW